ncbi:MAG TPA: nucleoside triphosphate pyrophosphohydrolase [Anaerolineales bacterium]|nr:nucleoside triphosphate pyrophosphohydrolase [Anaerolineales bacterium]
MSKTIYNKLIRDRIPEIIRADGKQYEIETMPEAEYVQALREKLVEEALEAQKAEGNDLIKELADLGEVMDALMAYYGIGHEQVDRVQTARRNERGAFEKRLKLIWSGYPEP